MKSRAPTIGILAIAAVSGFAVPQADAANIITFHNNPTSCGGSTLCSTNGTLGYGGTLPFNLSTIGSWFQITPDGISHLPGQPAEPNGGAGQFLVINDTGISITSFSLTLTDTFTSSTASVHACGSSICDNFQAGKGAGEPGSASEALSGPSFFSCTNGGAPGCSSTGGQAAADFQPNTVTFSWSGLNAIAPGSTFDITFAS